MMHLMSGSTGNTGTSAVITTATTIPADHDCWWQKDWQAQIGYPPSIRYPFQLHLEQPMKPAEKYLVIAQSNGAIHSRHETVEDAESAAARAAAKADEVYLVFRAVKQFQQKPVDVESKDL